MLDSLKKNSQKSSVSVPAGELVPPTRVNGAQGVLSPFTRRRFLAASSGLFGASVLGSTNWLSAAASLAKYNAFISPFVSLTMLSA